MFKLVLHFACSVSSSLQIYNMCDILHLFVCSLSLLFLKLIFVFPLRFQRRSNSMRHRRRHPGRPSSAYYEDSTRVLPISSVLPARGVTKHTSKRPSISGDRSPKKVENGSPAGELAHCMESSEPEGDKEGEEEKDGRPRSGSQAYRVRKLAMILPLVLHLCH